MTAEFEAMVPLLAKPSSMKEYFRPTMKNEETEHRISEAKTAASIASPVAFPDYASWPLLVLGLVGNRVRAAGDRE